MPSITTSQKAQPSVCTSDSRRYGDNNSFMHSACCWIAFSLSFPSFLIIPKFFRTLFLARRALRRANVCHKICVGVSLLVSLVVARVQEGLYNLRSSSRWCPCPPLWIFWCLWLFCLDLINRMSGSIAAVMSTIGSSSVLSVSISASSSSDVSLDCSRAGFLGCILQLHRILLLL